MPTAKPPEVHVYHATAPTCWWSWGYEATMNRLRLVYGDQIEIHLLLGTVYEDLAGYLKEYELTDKSWRKWAEESAQLMQTPIRTEYHSDHEPRNLLPATLAVFAAQKQGHRKGERFQRALLRFSVVEGKDVTQNKTLLAAATEAGLDAAAFRRDWADRKARKDQLRHQGEGFPEVPLGFYNLAVTDGANRTVLLDYAFDPRITEGAIDYLSDGKLTKSNPADVLAYLKENGPTPLIEVARVFAGTKGLAEKRLTELEGKGKVRRTILAGAPHWHPIDG